jgi:WD40 repeat protein
MTGHTAHTNSVDLSSDGSTVASSSNDGSIRLWDAATGEERFGGPMDHWDQAMSVAVAADGRSTVIASRDRMIRTVDLTTGELRRSVRVQGDLLNTAALSPDGSKAASAEGAAVSVYDLSTGRRAWSKTDFQPRPHLAETNGITTPGLVFSGDGRRLVSLTLDLRNGVRQRATVRVWDSATGQLVSQIVRNSYVDAPPVLLDGGRTLALVEGRKPATDQGRSERTACLGFYETETGRLLREQGSPELYSSALAAAPDSSWLATAGNNWVQVWDAASGTLAYTLGGMRYAKGVARLAISPDGTQIAAAEQRNWGGHSGTVYVWRVADGRRTHELPADATALAFAPDSRSLITCGADGTALVWDLSKAATAPPARRQPTDREIEARWASLACGYLPHLGDYGGRAPRVDALAEGGDRTVEFLTPRLLDPKLAQKDEAEVAALFRPLTDRDPKVRVQAAARLEQYGVHAEAYLSEAAKVPAPEALLDNERQSLHECFRDRRDERVYHVLRQIGTLRARWLLHRLAEGLPDDVDNRDRKRNAAETAAALDRARLRMPGQPIEQLK